MELRCSRDLALRLGAIEPKTTAEHREMKRSGFLLIRDIETCEPLFWALVPPGAKTRLIIRGSS